jgi:hypothetical protein
MLTFKQLRSIEADYGAAAENKTAWEGDRCLALAKQIALVAGHLADLMIPIPSAPPVDDEHVAHGCRLFSNPNILRA